MNLRRRIGTATLVPKKREKQASLLTHKP